MAVAARNSVATLKVLVRRHRRNTSGCRDSTHSDAVNSVRTFHQFERDCEEPLSCRLLFLLGHELNSASLRRYRLMLSYREYRASDRKVVILLHGSAGSGVDMPSPFAGVSACGNPDTGAGSGEGMAGSLKPVR